MSLDGQHSTASYKRVLRGQRADKEEEKPEMLGWKSIGKRIFQEGRPRYRCQILLRSQVR